MSSSPWTISGSEVFSTDILHGKLTEREQHFIEKHKGLAKGSKDADTTDVEATEATAEPMVSELTLKPKARKGKKAACHVPKLVAHGTDSQKPAAKVKATKVKAKAAKAKRATK